MGKDTIRIGEVASRIGLNPESIRYYERMGLLPRPRRSTNGYRIYTPDHLERVEFIKKAQALGFSLEEIREIAELKFSEVSPCQHVRDLLHEKLEAVEQQIVRLRAFRRELVDSLTACERALKSHSATKDQCPVLERLELRASKGRKQQ